MHLSLSLYRFRSKEIGPLALDGDGCAAVFVEKGEVELGGEKLAVGQALQTLVQASTLNALTPPTSVLAFVLSQGPPHASALASEKIEVSFPCLLRIDEVAFPPGVQAYRHVHPGPGFRHLRWGALHLEADDHAFDAAPGDTWFEAANSPVRATADAKEDETRFVRCMVLPPEFQGKPTIQILDPTDAAQPKKQTTHRHVDVILRDLNHFEAG